MAWNIERWIEEVRQKPEPVRLRYAVACVAVSMVVVVGIWLLSTAENFQPIAEEVGNATESAGTLLPKPTDYSLDALMKQNARLGEDKTPLSGQEFFQGEYGGKADPKLSDDAVAPKDETSPTDR